MDFLFKSTRYMNWMALITFLLILVFVVDHYRGTYMLGLIKKG